MSNNYSSFQNSRFLYGDIEVSRAVDGPCPVCGHPTGNCVGNNEKPDHIIGENFQSESLKNEKMILVETDIYETRPVSPFTSTNVLVHRAGTYVTQERAKELNILKT